jgi:hypothetical protein
MTLVIAGVLVTPRLPGLVAKKIFRRIVTI